VVLKASAVLLHGDSLVFQLLLHDGLILFMAFVADGISGSQLVPRS